MSLLTEEQVKELENLHIVWRNDYSYTSSYFDYLKDWNEKQTGVQINVDWNNAPISASRAELQIAWYNSDNFLVSEDVLAYVPRPPTPHPHAEIIAKYAEVAARRCDPWVEFEWTSGEVGSEDWKVCHEVNTGFNYGRRYRHIGDKQ